jgi:hypothetical protein
MLGPHHQLPFVGFISSTISDPRRRQKGGKAAHAKIRSATAKEPWRRIAH